MTSSEQKKKRKEKKAGKKAEKDGRRWVTLAALEICMVAIQLALCMQLGTLYIQLGHLNLFQAGATI